MGLQSSEDQEDREEEGLAEAFEKLPSVKGSGRGEGKCESVK